MQTPMAQGWSTKVVEWESTVHGTVKSFRSLHFEPSLDASSLRSDVIISMKVLSP
jgi:hypothetical protein